MGVLADLLREWGGKWALAVLFAGLIAFYYQPKNLGWKVRVRQALSKPWFLVVASGIGSVAWGWVYVLLWRGDRYLPWAASRPWLPQWLLVGLVTAAAFAVIGAFRLPRFRPWLTLGLVTLFIFGSHGASVPAPDGAIREGDSGRHVRFIQARLARLNCYAAAGEHEVLDGDYGAETFQALVSFQMRNELLTAPADRRYLGQVRREREFRLLTHPLPLLGGPLGCGS